MNKRRIEHTMLYRQTENWWHTVTKRDSKNKRATLVHTANSKNRPIQRVIQSISAHSKNGTKTHDDDAVNRKAKKRKEWKTTLEAQENKSSIALQAIRWHNDLSVQFHDDRDTLSLTFPPFRQLIIATISHRINKICIIVRKNKNK